MSLKHNNYPFLLHIFIYSWQGGNINSSTHWWEHRVRANVMLPCYTWSRRGWWAPSTPGLICRRRSTTHSSWRGWPGLDWRGGRWRPTFLCPTARTGLDWTSRVSPLTGRSHSKLPSQHSGSGYGSLTISHWYTGTLLHCHTVTLSHCHTVTL